MDFGARTRDLARALSITLALAASGQAGATGAPLPNGENLRLAAPPAAAVSLAALSPPAPLQARDEPFGWATPSVPATLPDAERWRAIIAAVAADRAILVTCRDDPGSCPPAARRLSAIVEAGRAREGRARLGEVNRAVNLAIAYANDLLRHGLPPLATFASGRGDCEDYAIAKYLALLELGVAPRDLRLVVVETRRRGEHAVLGVRLDERWVVLDSAGFVMAEDRDLASFSAVAAFGGEDDAPPPAAAAPTIAAGAPTADPAARGGADDLS